MNINIDVISKNALFENVSYSNLTSMFACLNVRYEECKKGSYIFLEGQKVDYVGVVQKGKLAAVKDTYQGNRSILQEYSPSEMFGGAFACAKLDKAPISVLALSDSEVLLFDYKRIITTCSSACVFHAKLIENMLKILADDVLNLNDKLHVLSNRTTRDKLLAYFELQREIFNSDIFSIPLNREQLADFLFVDRSAMSRELSNMRDEGLIKFDKNNIELLI